MSTVRTAHGDGSHLARLPQLESMYHGRSCAIDELQSEKLGAMRAGRHFGLQHVGSLIRSPSLISLLSTEAAKFLATCLDEARPMVLTLEPQVRGDRRDPQGS